MLMNEKLKSLVLSIALALGTVPLGAMAQDAAVQINIPQQSLSEALLTLASQTHLQVFFTPDVVQGLTAPPVLGRMTAQDALNALLKGSGVTYRREGSGVTLSRGTGDATQLKPITVVGGRSANTEQSGSYTTPMTGAATGLSLSLRETPQSVSVVTRQFMDDQNLQTLVEVLKTAPGIAVTQLDSERYTFYSRGFSIDNIQYDGIPTSLLGSGDSEIDPIFYDRIEIVRGAAGLMSGAGQPSASINLVRKRANSKTFAGEVNISAGSWNNRRASVDLSVPVTAEGNVRARVVAAQENKDSFIDGYSRKRSTLYGVVDVDLTPATTISVGGSYQKSDVQGATYGGLPFWYSNGTAIDWKSKGRSFSIWPKWSTEEVQTHTLFANLDHQFANGWTGKIAATYRKQDLAFQRLFAWGFPDITTGLMTANPSRVQFPATSHQKGIDLNLAGPFSLAGRTHEAVVGLGYADEERTTLRRGAADSPAALSLFDWQNYPEPAAWGAEVMSEQYSRKQTGAYGALRLSLADPLTLIIGGRYNQWHRSGLGYNRANPYDYKQNKLTPYAGLVYDLNRDLSVYASYTSIFNPQNYRTRNGDFLDPLQGDSYELGIKGEFLNGALNASLAVFNIKQDNYAQVDPGYKVPGTTANAYVGAKGVTTRGIEVELSGEIQPGWNVAFNATHFRATDANGDNAATASPRTVARLFTAYRLPGDWHKLTIGGGVNWQSKVHNPTGVYHDDAPLGVGNYEQQAYALVNLMGRYDFSRQLSLQVNVNNLFDKWYQSAVNFNEQLVWGAPRNVMATLRYKF